MNSSWSETFNGECNKYPRGYTEENLMDTDLKYTYCTRQGMSSDSGGVPGKRWSDGGRNHSAQTVKFSGSFGSKQHNQQ